jgi:hypothetical protein
VSIDARLNRLMPALTARERALLVLRSLKDKKPQNAEWRRTMPRDQALEFNRYIVLMNACNVYLPLYISMVEQHTEQLYLRFYWWHTVYQFGKTAWDLAELVPVKKRALAARSVEACFPAVELPWDEKGHPYSWITVADEMFNGLRERLVSLWQELRSIDLVLDEVAEEFDGEDPLRPIMRGVVEKTRRDLTNLHEVLSVEEPLELPEPDEEEMALARIYFENGRKLMDRL